MSDALHAMPRPGAPATVAAPCPNGCLAVTRPVPHASIDSTEPWRVVACQGCGLMYTNPRPPASDWHLYYPDDYGPYQLRAPVRLGKRISLALEGWLGRVAGNSSMQAVASLLMDRTIPVPFGQRRMLDIGCGAADYLARLERAGWTVLGLEPSHRAAERARQTYDVPIVEDYFPSAQLEEGSFDLVTAHQVLEHLENPGEALANMRALLRPHGRILITVPNADSWSSRFFASSWIGWDLPRHLSHFTPTSIRKLAIDAGFRIIAIETHRQNGWIRESADRYRKSKGSRLHGLFREKQLSTLAGKIARWRGHGDNLLMIAERFDRDESGLTIPSSEAADR